MINTVFKREKYLLFYYYLFYYLFFLIIHRSSSMVIKYISYIKDNILKHYYII